MSNIRVDISSYDNFRRATFGKKYDTDGAFGYQCFDAADLLWRNISMLQRNGNSRLGRLRSSNGSAHGAWNGVIRTGENREAITPVNSNTYNARVGFDLITDVRKIKRGDVIVFGTGLGQTVISGSRILIGIHRELTATAKIRAVRRQGRNFRWCHTPRGI